MLRLVTPAATPILTTQEAKDQLRVDFADDDALIASYVAAATEMVDAEFGELGRALISQEWAQTFAGFSEPMVLTVSPAISVSGVTYFDNDNAAQTWAAENYRATIERDAAYIDLVAGAAFPASYVRPDAVTVTYTAGYGATAADVPEGIKQAVRLMVGHWYDQRGAVERGGAQEVPLGVRALLSKYRIAGGFI